MQFPAYHLPSGFFVTAKEVDIIVQEMVYCFSAICLNWLREMMTGAIGI